MRGWLVRHAALLIVCAACERPADAGGAMYVDEAVANQASGEVRLRGYLIGREGGRTRLCEEMLESFPPQCGGASVLVEGLDPESIGELSREEQAFWTNGEIELNGVLDGGVLRVQSRGA
jgi:hypothetical protein